MITYWELGKIFGNQCCQNLTINKNFLLLLKSVSTYLLCYHCNCKQTLDHIMFVNWGTASQLSVLQYSIDFCAWPIEYVLIYPWCHDKDKSLVTWPLLRIYFSVIINKTKLSMVPTYWINNLYHFILCLCHWLLSLYQKIKIFIYQ